MKRLSDAIFEAENDIQASAIKVKHTEAARELKNAKNELLAAQATLETMPALDADLIALDVISDVLNMREKPVSEQRAILGKYATKIWATGKENGKPKVEFNLRIPVTPPQDRHESLTEPDGTNGNGTHRVRHGHKSIAAVAAATRRKNQAAASRTFSDLRSSAWSMPCSSNRCPTRMPSASTVSRS